jgi:hypothetical protein
MSEAIGWRWWLLRDGATHLVSPWVSTHPAHSDDATCWRSTRLTASCHRDPQHRPPENDCICGVFVYRNKVANLLHLAAATRLGTLYGNVPPLALAAAIAEDDRPPFFVGGRVEIRKAVPGLVSGELRGSSGEIVDLFVFPDNWHYPDELRSAAEQLAKTYGVPVTVGAPEPTEADWLAVAEDGDYREVVGNLVAQQQR